MREVRGGAEAARVPPHDLDVERAVIGAMLVSETAVAAVAERLQAEDFYSEVHRVIFGAMMRLYARGDPIDQLTLTNELRSVGEFEKVGGRAYVFQIVESVPTAANAARYAEIVRGKALLRDIIDVGSRITEDAFREPEDVNEALDAAEQLVYGVSNRTLREHLAPVSELAPGVAEVSRAPIWIDDTAGVTLMEMRAKVRRLSSRLNAEGGPPLSLVVVDYLQLMVGQNNRSENRQQEIAEISRGLKVLARPVKARHDKRPLLSDLRDSGAIEQDADMVMFLYRDEYYNPDSDDKGIAEIIIGKHRNGPTGKVQLAWLEQYTKFASLARR